MGNSQLMLVIGAIILLSILIMNANRSILNSTELTVNSETILAANALANEMMKEICTKAFDDTTVASYIDESNLPNTLTSPQSLGPDSGETYIRIEDNIDDYTQYDDIDDYTGHSDTLSTPRTGDYIINISIGYVDLLIDPELIVTAQPTRTKRIEVGVSNPNLSDTLRLYYYPSY